MDEVDAVPDAEVQELHDRGPESEGRNEQEIEMSTLPDPRGAPVEKTGSQIQSLNQMLSEQFKSRALTDSAPVSPLKLLSLVV